MRVVGSKSFTTVYPRACGGTLRSFTPPVETVGLSPRLRGNRLAHDSGDILPRSIPAPAGEPVQFPSYLVIAMVYPRACGGTSEKEAAMTVREGLSPRLRGNQHRSIAGGTEGRSIPAPAGEPHGS